MQTDCRSSATPTYEKPLNFSAVESCLLTAYTLFTVWLFYPGFMSYDSMRQLSMARNGPVGDGHPPIMTIIWGSLDSVVPGPTLMLVFQVVGFVVPIALLARALSPTNVLARIPFYVVLIFPPVYGIAGIVWKDVWMQDCLLFGAFFTLAFVRSFRKSFSLLALACVAFFLAAGMRHNALAAIPPILAVACYFYFQNRHQILKRAGLAAISTAALCLAFLALNAVISAAVVERKSHFSQFFMAFDIAGTSVQTDENLFWGGYQNLFISEPTIAKLQARYTPRYHACLYRPCDGHDGLLRQTFNPDDLDRLAENWVSAVAHHPIAWLAHKANVAANILNFQRDTWAPTLRQPIIDNPWGIKYHDTDFKRWFRNSIFFLAETPLYDAYLYLTASLIGIGVVVALRKLLRPDAALLSIAIFCSGLFYELSLCLAATSPDFRYSVWMIICTILGYATLSVARKRVLK